ncbi:hypothetical protein ACFV97_12165 [Streptomyces sp. NPDC059913]|uniref:hypothetical protein n=1 Tax=unclassified Streptomyces TaxID=2593676 RepID=UPI00364C4E46
MIAAVVVAVVAATAGFLGTRESEEERFRNSARKEKFCKAAAPLSMENAINLTPHRRDHTVEELREAAPDGISEDFDRLIAWYEKPEPVAEKDARNSSFRVGEFIERVCAINIGGIRS